MEHSSSSNQGSPIERSNVLDRRDQDIVLTEMELLEKFGRGDLRLGSMDRRDPATITDDALQAEEDAGLIGRFTQVEDAPLTPYLTHNSEKSKTTFDCYATFDPEEITAARRLVASRYLKLGFVRPEELTEEGVLSDEADPYASHSTYYILKDSVTGDLVATSRVIHYDEIAGDKSLPVWEHKDELDQDYVKRIEEIGIENCAEISSLVRSPAYKPNREITMQLYRRMFQDVWSAGDSAEKAWLMACKPSLFKNFKVLFDGSMKRIGPDLDYPGEPTVPAMFELQSGSKNLIDKAGKSIFSNLHSPIHRKVVSYILEGADANTLDPVIVDALQQNNMNAVLRRLKNDETVEGSDEQKTMRERLAGRKPEIYSAAFLLGYTALRTVGVAEGISPHTNVDWRVFLGIEVATTYPYVMGVGDLVRSTINPDSYTDSERVRAGTIAATSLAAPYAYVAAEGHDMPTSAWAGVGVFAAVAVASVAAKIRKGRRQRDTQAELVTDIQPAES